MLLTITATGKGALDLGYLLHKHPGRCQSISHSYGMIHVFYPEAAQDRCTAALAFEVDAIGLIRGRKQSYSPLAQYVNDRPYAASSFLSSALAKAFNAALNGKCKDKPELVAAPLQLEAKIGVLPCRGKEELLKKLFEPLGYSVTAQPLVLDEQFPEWGESYYYSVTLAARVTLQHLLQHLYVLIPVLDNQKHYFVDPAEIEKLLQKGGRWLESHPAKELITRRYFKYKRSYAREALNRLLENTMLPDKDEKDEQKNELEEKLERKMNLNEIRLGTVLSALKSSQAASVVDIGCGEGKLLHYLLKEKQFTRIVGMDVALGCLEIAADKLKLDRMSEARRERIDLIQGSVIYRDKRLEGFDAAAVVEVIEHLDASRLAAFERVLFEFVRAKTVVLTTPNIEYNSKYENMNPGSLRHKDHRFEWTREEFYSWSKSKAASYGYRVRFLPVGEEDPELGAPTQMAIFTLQEVE